ncbi:hypothetical protein [Paraclostridium sordellii]|uniref:Uncharacterized protein n=1 Tax=Paraclostridium sordellii TaxID=1505 RepID=A0A0C7R597_PARSO|nr:hypothetical protein [Paeniclostridium sordellii]CEN78949.1 Uncharacterised protein [[Clostridium] sordellii] [Paeniclostridium sordellii]CEQ04045.1 Uncharacterised protein [[Clostridium] sordellii] [Paeniclostridium sordellii]
MNKKAIIGIIIAIIFFLILSIGIKLDETGFHGVMKVGEEFINLFLYFIKFFHKTFRNFLDLYKVYLKI